MKNQEMVPQKLFTEMRRSDSDLIWWTAVGIVMAYQICDGVALLDGLDGGA